MKTTVHRYWKYAAILLAVSAACQVHESARVRRVLDGVYDYNVEITVVDKDTGSALSEVRIGYPHTSSTDLFQQASGTLARTDGHLEITGVGYEPRKWTFGREGYEDFELIVDRATPSSVRVKLEKSVPKKSPLPTGNNPTTPNSRPSSSPAAE